MPFDKNILLGVWLHAHEEDTLGREVFRPESYPLPPSRGRSGYAFFPDGRVRKMFPGPTDRPIQVQGTWVMDDEGRITISIPAQPDVVLELDTLKPEQMIIIKQ